MAWVLDVAGIHYFHHLESGATPNPWTRGTPEKQGGPHGIESGVYNPGP